MKTLLLLGIAIGLSACTNVYYASGKKAASIGSNVNHFAMKSDGLDVTADGVDNAIIHKTAGDTVNKVGVAAAFSGVFPFLQGIIK